MQEIITIVTFQTTQSCSVKATTQAMLFFQIYRPYLVTTIKGKKTELTSHSIRRTTCLGSVNQHENTV
jgi:hypothetical protein